MPAFKLSASRIFAGLAVSAFSTPIFAATLVVNNEAPLDITTPPGFTYIVQGTNGSLSVPTQGYLFCANLYTSSQQPSLVTVVPQHGDWLLPIAQDVSGVAYNAGLLGVNRNFQTSLVCHGVGAEGETPSPATDGLLRNGYETKTVEQFSNLVNWVPPVGFNWNSPDWTIVPTDPCAAGQSAEIDENVACAAVTGSRAGGSLRSPTMWAGTDGVNFYYVVRVDASYGPLQGVQAHGPQLPATIGQRSPNSATSVMMTLVEGFDRGVVGVGGGYLGDTGQWCVLATLPTGLSSNICNGAFPSGTLSGPANIPFEISLLPGNPPRASFYAAFVRPIVGPPPTVVEPVSAVSILIEPSLLAEGGDSFRGDDVSFAFLPTSTGFPWMTGGQ